MLEKPSKLEVLPPIWTLNLLELPTPPMDSVPPPVTARRVSVTAPEA